MSYANLMQWFHAHVYGYALNLMQAVTGYMHQVFNYNNNKNGQRENNFSLKEKKKKIISEKQCHNISVMNYLLSIKRK